MNRRGFLGKLALLPLVAKVLPALAEEPKGAIFLLNGCVDTRDSGNALFPEILKSEFHGIRATIEAYSAKEKLHGRKEASACGIDLRTWNQTFRVTTATSRISYKIDRWD